MRSIFSILVFSTLAISFAVGQINERCSNDNQCGDKSKNLECIQGFCKCKIGYRIQNNYCELVLGKQCSTDRHCENFPGAICEKSVCICKTGNIAGTYECLKVGEGNDDCEYLSECVERFNDNNIECNFNTKKCICKSGYHHNTNKKCIETLGLGDSCTNRESCYLNVKEQNALECLENTCRCKEGYVEDNNTCNGSHSFMAFSIITLLILTITTLKF